MAGGKETPRQKMIGMMYLVLTALLALNISKEILNGFVKVERGLVKTQTTLKAKALETYSEIEKRFDSNKEKVGPFMDAASEVKRRSESLRGDMQRLKAVTMAASEGQLKLTANGELSVQPTDADLEPYLTIDESGAPMCIELDKKRPEDKDKPKADQKKLIEKPDAYDNVTLLLYGRDIANPREGAWSAVELRKKLENYRDYLKSITFIDAEGLPVELPRGLQASIDQRFQFPNEFEQKEERTWEYSNFNHVPLAAVMPIMSKLIIDVQDAEQDVLTFLNSRIDGESFKVNEFRPLLVPQSNYVLEGDTIRAQVMLAGFDKTNKPDIYVSTTPFDGDSTFIYEGLEPLAVDSAEGFGDFRLASSDVGRGEHRFKTTVVYYDQYNQPTEYNLISDPITVAPPSVVVSPLQMKVFYRGVDNPVDISIPGIPKNNLTASINSPHKISKNSDGTWTVRPGKGTKARLSITAKFPDGSSKTMSSDEFKVKKLPDPTPRFGRSTIEKPSIKKAQLRLPPSIKADMLNFDFTVEPIVKGFTFGFVRNGAIVRLETSSDQFTQEMKEVAQRFRVGDRFFIEDIKVDMPDGQPRILAPLNLVVE